MPEETTVTFTKEKKTKNTIKYAEDERAGKPPIVGSLYLQKWFAAGREKVTVTIR